MKIQRKFVAPKQMIGRDSKSALIPQIRSKPNRKKDSAFRGKVRVGA